MCQGVRAFAPVAPNRHTRRSDYNRTQIVECIKPVQLAKDSRGILECITPLAIRKSRIAANSNGAAVYVIDAPTLMQSCLDLVRRDRTALAVIRRLHVLTASRVLRIMAIFVRRDKRA